MNKDLYPEHMKKTYKSTIRKQATQQKGTKDLDRDFTKRQYGNGKQAYEVMFMISNYQENSD